MKTVIKRLPLSLVEGAKDAQHLAIIVSYYGGQAAQNELRTPWVVLAEAVIEGNELVLTYVAHFHTFNGVTLKRVAKDGVTEPPAIFEAREPRPLPARPEQFLESWGRGMGKGAFDF
jgi:hypothetical protein